MIKILGTGSYVPEKILTNFDLEKTLDTSDTWIVQRTGIHERRIAAPEESTVSLSVAAAKKALAAAEVSPKDVDLLILTTSTADYQISSSAPIIANELGCGKIPAFDLNAVCAGFVYGFCVAAGLLESGMYKNCLLIGSDVYSRILNWEDRNSCILFGDGAGAILLKKENGAPNILAHDYSSDGSGSAYIRIPVGGSKIPYNSNENIAKEDLYFKMEGKKVYEFTIKEIPACVKRLIEKANIASSDLDAVIFHQANIRIIDAVAKDCEIPIEKFFINIQKYGNTSSASVPLALDEAVRKGKIKTGDKVMLLGFGGGLSWGGVILEWQ
ncbi:MAG: ketoacyl-ACP synthase III [Spirochaetales bacterium]|nr:ketoacyl-ACP synthase III [Spirochaetales bacterium]